MPPVPHACAAPRAAVRASAPVALPSPSLARAEPPVASWPRGASRLVAACAVAALGPAGCGPSIAPTLTEAPPNAAVVTRAEGWIRHAGREDHEISQSIEVEGRCLAVTTTGLRALSARAEPWKCEGPWEIAARRLPPIAAVRRVDKGFAFLTEGGVAWLSDSPLGAPTGPLRPPVRIEPIGGAFVGLDAAGRDADWGLADGLVLHGSPGEPCGAALRASSLAGSWMIVLDGSLGRGWLLRVGPPDTGERRGPRSRLTVSPVVCREAPSRRPPADVIEAARTESPTTRMHPPGKK